MDYRSLENIVSDTIDSNFLDSIKARANQTDILPLLDVELQRSASRLQRLQEYRNSFSSPMYRLLPEILSRIFFIYAQDSMTLFDMRWTKLLLVCRRWYDVGMFTPSLWSFIAIQSRMPEIGMLRGRVVGLDDQDARDVRRIEAQRARAGRYPLTVAIDLHFVHQLLGAKEIYLSMFWDPSSLLSLTINGQPKSIIKILRAVSARQHLNLESLTVRSSDFTEADAMKLEERSLLDGVLKGNTPKLHSLRVNEIPFDLALAHGLRALKVGYYPNSRVSFHIGDVIDALDRSPLLEDLNLTLPVAFNSTIDFSREKLTLPHINSLSLFATAAISVQILQALGLPSTAKISVQILGSAVVLNSLWTSLVASHLGSHAYQRGAPAIRSISVCYSVVALPGVIQDGMQQLEVAGQCHLENRGTMRPKSTSSSGSPFIALQTRVVNDAEDNEILDMLRRWPLSNVTQLDMRFSKSTSSNWWGALFAELPAVTTIFVWPEYSSAQSLVEFLCTHLSERSGLGLLANIVFDAAEIGRLGADALITWPTITATVPDAARARSTIMRFLSYCTEAARAGISLDTLEIINEPRTSQNRVLEPSPDFDWRELYKDLREGFKYVSNLGFG